MIEECRLTTIDNPYDPFDEFDKWFLFDIKESNRYGLRGCCERVALEARTSDAMTEDENNYEIERAIDSIIVNDPLNIYMKVKRKTS